MVTWSDCHRALGQRGDHSKRYSSYRWMVTWSPGHIVTWSDCHLVTWSERGTMSGRQIAIYRLPIPTATRVGHVRVVTDRSGRHYIDESRVVEAISSGIHTTLKLANGRSYHVLTT